MSNKSKFYSGFISIIGRPNVGKSTLMNSLIGEKLAIVSDKPQTTRNKIQCILTTEDFQAVFIDTPGIHKPHSKLGSFMVNTALEALNEVDIILYVVEPENKVLAMDKGIIERLSQIDTPVFLLINKIDKTDKPALLNVIETFRNETPFEYAQIIPISAAKGENMEALLTSIKTYLPEGPQYFPEDSITDQPERQLVAELIREKALQLLDEELPHGTAVEILSMKKRPNKDLVDISANIYCERDSHKGMIIGKGGKLLKELGTRARTDITRLLGSPVYLELWVKVKKNWRDNEFMLKNFGYERE